MVSRTLRLSSSALRPMWKQNQQPEGHDMWQVYRDWGEGGLGWKQERAQEDLVAAGDESKGLWEAFPRHWTSFWV